MKRLNLLLIFLFALPGCKQANKQNNTVDKQIEFNQGLADELKALAAIDQIAAYIPQGTFKEWSQERWNTFKDSVFTNHKTRLEEIFNQFGYPGYSLVGESGERNFWVMVQHCDSDPDFQSRVLEKLKIEMKNKNADGRNFGLLTDRVKLNTGGKQIYGTQVTYNSLGQAYPKNLDDSINVNKRRAEVGLAPIEIYLNEMSQMHFEMNKELFLKRGITGPKVYKTNN